MTPRQPHRSGQGRSGATLLVIASCLLALVIVPAAWWGFTTYRSNPTWPTSRVQSILQTMDANAGDEPIMEVGLDRRDVRMTTQSSSGQRVQTWSSGNIRESRTPTTWRGRKGVDLTSLNMERAIALVKDRDTRQLTIRAGEDGADPTITLVRADGSEVALDRDMQPR